jgi:hypothetical protein
MFKAVKRVLALFAFLLIIAGALKSLFSWVANSSNDNHEVFSDEDEREPQF